MKNIVLLFAATFCTLACSSVSPAADNQLTEQEQQAGWQLLFNGTDYTGWKCNNAKEVASDVVDNAMQPYKSGGYLIVHEKQFGDFILKCDVKMPETCNSGIFFRVEDLANPVHTGFEAQIATGNGVGVHDFGAIYDIVPTTKNASKGPGQWNHVEIKCEGAEVSIKINGELVSQLDADELDQPGEREIAGDHKFKLNGKSRAIKDFARVGYLGFQDHGHPVWYKNVKLLPLN
ncbi:hypothetical protein Pla52o_06090 [Novipirellula galeiformis]|uniref:3-keto-alpha-glucoside-1,2-lyase/3-keto-2-hydroxy-glucal hydratase domain-containing protein n=1 Tax=Novipirellula galeiformis TaxID=2528004 RepID=A0A5C6CSA2_9BACT|nr:DUF1080 domain-containing protein [Novipirellula galeiformis]TWU26755.1 hypothetical protein Pla52o_06090 [Novipirellula galeiformis]